MRQIGPAITRDLSLSEAKRSLRRRMRGMCSGLGEARRGAASDAVARRLLHELAQRCPPRCAVYAARRDELSLRPFFDAIRALGHVPLFPRIRGLELEFVPVRSWSDLREGRYGVLEPQWGQRGQSLQAGDFAVLPGLAFDRAGYRLGRGGGFYDRAFGSIRSAPLLIGAAYAFQLLARVPHGSRDQRVDAIVTEQGFVWPRGRR